MRARLNLEVWEEMTMSFPALASRDDYLNFSGRQKWIRKLRALEANRLVDDRRPARETSRIFFRLAIN